MAMTSHSQEAVNVMAGMSLRSTSFDDHTMIPGRHAHDQDNISPSLEWSGVPEGTAELLLLCEDPDAPSGTFLHWLVTEIDPTTSGVAENSLPRSGREWPNGFGERGWGGPQPPPGDQAHRYFFHVYALPESVELPPEPTADDVHRVVDRPAQYSGTLVGLYQR